MTRAPALLRSTTLALATLLVPFLLVKAGVQQARENRADAQN